MATHSSTLAWKFPWTEEPGRLQSMRSRRVRHDWATSLSLFTFMHCRRKRQLTPVFLPGESQGRGSLMDCRLWGHTESDMTATAAVNILLWTSWSLSQLLISVTVKWIWLYSNKTVFINTCSSRLCFVGHSLPATALEYTFQSHNTSVIMSLSTFHILKFSWAVLFYTGPSCHNGSSSFLFLAVGLFILKSLFIYTSLKYSWLTVFQVHGGWFIDTYTHILFLRLFSIIGYYKILTIVPCAVQ